MSAPTKPRKVVRTPERVEALHRAVQENPGLDTETLCTFVVGVHQSSVYNMLCYLEAKGYIFRRRPSTRIVWHPCGNSGLDVLLRRYCPPPDESKVAASRHINGDDIPPGPRAERAHAVGGTQSSLGGGNYTMAPRSVGGRRGGGD